MISGMARNRKQRRAEDANLAKSGPTGEPGGELSGLEIRWNGASPRQWDGLIARIERSNIEQTWAYGEALAGMSPYYPIHAIIWRGRTPVAMAQVFEWPVRNLLRIAKVIRGPLFLEEVEPEERAAVMTLIKRRYTLAKRSLLFWTPELRDNPLSQAVMRTAGLRRTVTGYSSIWLDLTGSEDTLRAGLHQKWRNQLRTAEKSGLKIAATHGGAALEWLLPRHDAHRRKNRFKAPVGDFVRAIAICNRDRLATTVLTASQGSEPVAAILIFRHGRAATYYIAWSGEKARAVHANNLLLWQAVLGLKAEGVEWLDLGGIDGLTMPGVARFKLGLGGEMYTLAGTFL